MRKDARQLRTSNDRGLLGYRAKKGGKDCIAVMNGKGQELTEHWKCLGYIFLDELQKNVRSGPFIDLDNEDYHM